MLQIQQQLIDELQYQLESNPPLPEDLSTWAEHPVTIYFLNQFRLNVIDKQIDPRSACLTVDVSLLEGYSRAVLWMEESIEDFRKGVEGDANEA